MQNGVVNRVFVTVAVSLVNNYQILLVCLHYSFVILQGLFQLAGCIYGSCETEIIPVATPLFFQVRRTNHKCPQTEITGNGRSDDTFAQSYNIGHYHTIVILDGIDGHLYGIRLVFQIGELAIGNIVRSQQVLCCGDSKVFLEYTEVHLVGAIQLFKPDSVNNLRVEVIDMILVGNNHRLLPKLLENGLRISI